MTRVVLFSVVFLSLSVTTSGIALFSVDVPGFQQTKCVKSCPLGGEMSCGSDGTTYASVCHMQKHSCETKTELKVVHPGSCACPKTCNKNYMPVCATVVTSGKERTYPNLCQLRRIACQMKLKNVTIKFNRTGPCKKMSKCPSGCQDIFAPVCGGDKKTYSSICSLKLSSCKTNKKIRLIKIGRCSPNSCPESCPMTYQPICGSNGLLYPNECEMKLTACKIKKVIKKVRRKKEKKFCGKKCVAYCTDEVSPVCGEDGVTYTNECKMVKMNCENGKKIKVAKREKCGNLPNKLFEKK